MRIVVVFSMLLICFSCNRNDSVPKDVLSPKKMEPVLVDYFNAEAYAKEIYRRDSTKNDTAESIRLQTLVFKKHHLTKSEFYRSFNYYNTHPELMAKMLDSIIAHHTDVEKRNRKRLFFKEYE